MALKPEAQTTGQARSIPTYLALFIFGFIYEIILVYDALARKNTIQVIGLCSYNLGLLIYAALQIDQIHTSIEGLTSMGDTNNKVHDLWTTAQPFLIAVPCIIALGTILMSVVAWKLYDEFAWTIYKHISADVAMKRRYLTYQVSFWLWRYHQRSKCS
jgi:hypothetical protein